MKAAGRETNVILLTTHVVNDFVLAQYRKLRNETKSQSIQVILLVQEEFIGDAVIPCDIEYYPFSMDSLNELNYEPIEETIVPGSNHFPVLQFYREYPDYEYYWNIEFDVVFSGDWGDLFSIFEDVDTDFVTSHIERIDEALNWSWWHSIYLNTLLIPCSKYLKSFNPVYRLSNQALFVLDDMLSSGISGHHEILLPTLLAYCGFSIGDLGGEGSFILPGFRNRFYTRNSQNEGYTMRYRPLYHIEDVRIDTKLYHPIKGW